ncbi:MAG: hypothetical protein JNJ48_08035 [Phycisphaerae bacterium]|nr:hypothetical protein [Phycisphaerae bacterium]
MNRSEFWNHAGGWAGVMAAVTLTASLLWAQPEQSPPGSQPIQPGKGPGRTMDRPERMGEQFPADPAALRAFLERRAEASRRQVERFESALRDLESGKDATEVRRGLLQREMRERGEGEGPDAAPGGPAGGPGNRGQPQATGPLGEPMVRLPEHERAASMDVVRGERPDLADRIERMAAQPEVRERIYEVLGTRLRGLAELKRSNDPEMLTLRLDEIKGVMDIIRLSTEYGRAKRAGDAEAGLTQIRDAIRASAAEQFDIRLKIQQRQVEQLIRRSERMRADLGRLADERDRIIDEKTAQLLRVAERLPERRKGK